MDSCVEEQPKKRRRNLSEKLEEIIAGGARTVDPFAKSLNMEILWADPQEAEGIMYIDSGILNPYGIVHGGCLVALADTVSGHNLLAAGKICVTLSSTVNFLRPAKGKFVRCHSQVQKLGKQVSVVAVEETDDKGQLLTTALFTFSAVEEIPPHIIVAQDS